MTEQNPIDPFEGRLSDLVRAYTEPAADAFDPLDLAMAAKVARKPRGSVAARWWPRESGPALALLLVTAALVIALVAAALMIGRRPTEFGQVPDALLYIRDSVSLVVADADGTGERVLADVRGRDAVSDQVRWSPSHRFIAHEDDVALTPDVTRTGLVIRTADGVEVGRTDPAPEGWAWSPIEDVIAYGRGYDTYDPSPFGPCVVMASPDPCTGAIVIVGPDARPLRTIGHAIGSAYVSGWSPDGERLLVTGCALPCRGGVGSEIWVVEADGSGIQAITDTPGMLEWGPAWSPDGARIAFSSRSCDECHDSLSVMDADGTDPQLIADDGQQSAGPLWSPDGSRLLYGVSYPEFRNSTAFTARSDIFVWESGRTRQLTSSEIASPIAWSSDGSRILIRTSEGIRDDPRSSLEVIGAEGWPRYVLVRNVAEADW